MMARTLLRLATLLACLGLLAPGAARADEGYTTTVYITGTLVDAPECTVNASNQLNVSFGDDIITYQVDGQNYKKRIEYILTCTSLAQQGLTMTLSGTPAGFNNSLFKTSNDGLGIRITGNDEQVSPGGAIGFTYTNQPVLYAVPVAKDATALGTGPFNGTATMVVTYQ